MWIKFVKKRNWDIVNFDKNFIQNAIEKAHTKIKKNSSGPIDEINFEEILETICCDIDLAKRKLDEEDLIWVEDIQDIVEKNLMETGQYDVAKEYILYRNEQKKIRAEEKIEIIEKIEHNQLHVIKDDWSKEVFDMWKIEKIYNKIAGKLSELCPFVEIEESIKKYIVDEIKTVDINKLLVKAAVNLISMDNIHRQFIAWRFLTIDLYKKASRERDLELKELYTPKAFADFVKEYVEAGRYYEDFFKYYSMEDILEAGKYLVPERDMEYGYTTLLMLNKRYLCNPNKIVKEIPQYMYLAVALFLAIPEKKEDRLKIVKEIYEATSTQKLSLATPTLMNARRKFHQLSSCFVLNADDDLRSIYHNIENIAQISKYGGWVGTYLGNVRSRWGTIRWVKWVSGWIIPWIKVINDTAIAVNQLWARAGAVSITTDIRHRDIYDFLALQTETGDMRRKSFDIFPAISVPDIFMKRVKEGGKRTLFDPKEVMDMTWKKMQDLFWDEFEEFYIECENNDKLELKKETDAKDLFKTFLKVVVETGMPYVFFRDESNKLNPNKHVGNVYSSQLCTEIIQNTSPSTFVEEEDNNGEVTLKYKMWDTVVCNLASINIAKVNTKEEMEEIIPISMRVLDNVIELNLFPIKEAKATAEQYRSVGLWFLWLAEYLATNKMMYDSKEARDATDDLFENYAYHVIKASNDLSKERWAYPLFEWSEWSKGIILWKDEERFKANSKYSDKRSELISDVQEKGLRFSYHMSPAPNTSTANVVWTTAGLLPIYKKYFVYTDNVAPSVNVAPKLSMENTWFYKEYVNMKMPEVIDMIATTQKWIDQSISFEWIIDPANTSPKDLYNYYMQAWKWGIKTVYYVRSMTLDVKECASCSW